MARCHAHSCIAYMHAASGSNTQLRHQEVHVTFSIKRADVQGRCT